MSKFMGVIIGALEIVVGVVLLVTPFAGLSPYLISSGVGMVIAGIGTILAQGPLTGAATLSRNPVAPWNVLYGRGKVGGILVYVGEFDEVNKYLDMVVVLNCHSSKSVDSLIFNSQRIRLDANGCSFTPTQQTIGFVSITRVKDVVTAVLSSAITDLQTGDSLQIQNVSDHTFNGKYAVTVVDSVTFTYICGGTAASVSSSGQALTLWPNYKSKVYCEFLLGDHSETFPGMIYGTPYDGDTGNLVINSNNPWTSEHKLLGKTCAFLRLHYNDEIFANGLPTIAFRLSGKNDIYDPRLGPAPTVVARATTTLNGWGNNAHVGPYEMGVDQATGWGLNNDTTFPYLNPDSAVDGDLSTTASIRLQHTHQYAGCIWSFASLFTSPAPHLWLNVRSEVPPSRGSALVTLRSAGIWYSLDAGTTWTVLYNSTAHRNGWDAISLPLMQDFGQVQVMAFTDSHDDMVHFVGDVNLATGSFTGGYTENAALCIADFLAQPTWGFKANYGTDIPLDRLISAANICDEAVPLAAGGTEPRYLANGGFPLTMKRGEVLQNLLTSCAGRLTYTQGQYVIHPAAWEGSGSLQPFPFPPPTGQGVAWAFARIYGPPGTVNIPPSIWNGNAGVTGSSGATPTSGFATVVGGDVFADPSLSVGWSSYTLPSEIPPGATITGVYATATGLVLPSSQGLSLDYVNRVIDGRSLGWDGTPVNVHTLAGLTMIGLTTGPQSLPLGGNSVSVGFVGLAVYYDFPSGGGPIVPFGSTAETLAIAAGPFRWREKVSIRDLYNGVKGTYVSPANNWQASDIPPYAQDIDHGYMSGSPMYPLGDANMAADGGDRRWLDIQLPFTVSVATAQRLCKVELMRRRQQGTGTFTYNLAMYKTLALDVIQMTLPILGWTNKLLEIAAHRFTINKQQIDGNDVTLLGTEIDVQETDPSVYEWSDSEELTAQGFQQPSVPGPIPVVSDAPSAIAFASDGTTAYIGSDGINHPRILITWLDPLSVLATQVQIQYQVFGASSWISLIVPIGIQQAYVSDVIGGQNYIFQLRSMSASGTTSPWALTSGGSPTIQWGPVLAFAPNSQTNSYSNTPALALTQYDAITIAMAAVATNFGGTTVNYVARHIPISGIVGTSQWFYVVIHDPTQAGESGTATLVASADVVTILTGAQGYTYMGAILMLSAGGATRITPGGWPAPASSQVGV
jgi:hypothetical protein